MSPDALRNLLNAKPFRPFTVRAACGRVLRIADPEFAMLTPKGQTLLLAQAPRNAVEVLDVTLITRVEIETS